MKLTTITLVSVDGVMQGMGGPNEDRRGGFERGGWLGPLMDLEAATYLHQVFERADAFLLGRRTYDIFAPHWSAITDSANAVATIFNSRPKYVASNTLTEPEWANTTVLSGDVEAAIRELKATRDGELQVHGSGELVRWLIERELVDELVQFVCPVVLGQGSRLFAHPGPDVALDIVDSRSTPNGVVIQVGRPAGRPRYARAG